MRTFDRRSLPQVESSESQEKSTEESAASEKLLPKEKKDTTHFKSWLIPLLVFALLTGLCFYLYFYEWQRHPKSSVSIPLPGQVALYPLVTIQFNDSSFFREWKEHVFNGKTSYRIEMIENSEKVLHATSHGTSSVLFKQVDVSLSKRPFLTWEWKAASFPSKKQDKVLAARSDNDFVARIYIAFRGRIPLSSDVIQYVWDDHFPVGTSASSPFARSNKVLVIRSGQTPPSESWVAEKRDLVADYQKLFGKNPHGNVMAIGLMSDSDNTGTESEAYFRRLSIQKSQI